MTTDKLQAALAAMMVPCPNGVDVGGKRIEKDGQLGAHHPLIIHANDCTCKGTNTVPLFPDEREECAVKHVGVPFKIGGQGATEGEYQIACWEAGCPGYSVRAADGIRVMVSIQRLGLMFNLHSCFPPDESICLIWQVDDGKKKPWQVQAIDADPNAAAYAAAVAAANKWLEVKRG